MRRHLCRVSRLKRSISRSRERAKNHSNLRRSHERWDGRISGDGVPSRAQDFQEFNIVLGAPVDSPEGCNGVLNLRGSQPRISFRATANLLRFHRYIRLFFSPPYFPSYNFSDLNESGSITRSLSLLYFVLEIVATLS
ncbi:hypothetical protein PUN28_009615 [Cardiocondyla obscurior]|uniref:Uncharacterized protein n=1 Tax=Cardiocondyla obscurior TaxID=286306 RepID=A0AAW2FV10_9HYME